ncbi:hypothetical protein [Nocardioides sp. HLT2-9]|uniref:FTP domain-containing protein n=1 Tax=Nocardioides zhouii TaxID=1168729 RepID=A0A4Q2SQ63_9ACTN|nr:hypothetical protein EUA94_15495 [Nocardioides zhouii]
MVALPSTAAAPGAAAQPSTASSSAEGSFTLQGDEAAAYRVPGDVEEIWRSRFADGTTQTRYQQVVDGADVLDGQVTVLKDATGITTVIGAHFTGLRPANSLQLAPSDAL